MSTPEPILVGGPPPPDEGQLPLVAGGLGRSARARRLARRVALRLLGALVVIWAVATLTFFVEALLTGNRAEALLNQESGTSRTVERTAAELAPINEEYGFDKPILTQYWEFISGIAHGDFGESYLQHEPVLTIISRQVGPTIALTVSALLLAWLISLTRMILTAKRGRFISGFGSGVEIFTAGLPSYWLGVILLVVFAIELQIFPVQGGTSLVGLVLPAITLAVPLSGFLGQVTRDEFEKVLEQPFVTSARTRGLGDLKVRLRHVLRHAVLPAVTLSGWALGALISGAVLVEAVFARPGIGNMIVTAAESRDVPLVSGIVILVATVYVVANLLVDIAYTVIDPRMRTA